MAHRADLQADKQPWQTKLADLKYAKKFPSLNDREAGVPRTGTPYFMPLEIMLEQYLFDPRTQEHRNAVARQDKPKPSKDKVRDKKQKKGGVSSQPDPTRHVIHNFQHDLESLWWILLWTVTCRIDSEAAFAYGRPIFVNQIIPTHERRNCFIAKSIVAELERFLPLPQTEEDDTLAEMIDNLRDFMNDAYVARISEGNEDKPEHYVEIFDDFTFCFNVIENTASNWADIPLIVRTATQAQPESVVPGRRKRTCEEESIADARQVDGEERSEAKMPKIEETLEDRK